MARTTGIGPLVRLTGVLFAASALFGPGAASGRTFQPGEIVVLNGRPRAINPDTFQSRIVSLPYAVYAIAADPDGTLLTGGDLQTHTRRIDADGAVLQTYATDHMHELAVGPDGTAYFTGSRDSDFGVFRIDRTTGEMRDIAAFSPRSIVAGPGGSVYALRSEQVGETTGRVVRIDGNTGEQVTVTQGGLLVNPIGMGMDELGRLLFVDPDTEMVVRVDPETGLQTGTPILGTINSPRAVAFHPSLGVLVVDRVGQTTELELLAIDPETGARRSLLSLGASGQHVDIAVVPLPEPIGIAAVAAGLIPLLSRPRRRAA